MPEPGPNEPALPSLPRTWYARRTRRAAVIASLALMLVVVVTVIVLPREFAFSVGDQIAMVAFGLLLCAIVLTLARSYVRATTDGVTVVNVILRRHLAYAQIVHVRLGRDDAWAVLDLDDGSTLATLGIATSDGDSAHQAVIELAALVAQFSETSRDD